MNRPTISIVTVVFNGEKYIERTILSIINQNYDNFEYLIVDGCSKDNTINIIKKYNDRITKWISEPDNGLYDAMNKGLQMATGEYIWFLNAGDTIYNSDVLSTIFMTKSNADVFYGKTMVVDEQGNEIGLRRLKPNKPLTWRSFQMGQLVSHQAFIARKALTPQYDLRYNHSADTDWQINILRKSSIISDTDLILCGFLDGGKSKQNIIPSLKERFHIFIKNYGLLRTIFNHFVIGVKFLFFVIRNRRF